MNQSVKYYIAALIVSAFNFIFCLSFIAAVLISREMSWKLYGAAMGSSIILWILIGLVTKNSSPEEIQKKLSGGPVYRILYFIDAKLKRVLFWLIPIVLAYLLISENVM